MTTIPLGKRKADAESWIEHSQQRSPAAILQNVNDDQGSANNSNAVSDAVASSTYHAKPVLLKGPRVGIARHPTKKIHPIPPPGSRVLDKSCARCRIRKVKCDRIYPVCANCHDRKETCNLVELANLLPKSRSTIFKITTPGDEPEDARIAILERRLADLESHGAQSATSYYADATASTSTLPPWSAMEHGQSSIGPASLDWRLGKPTMARSLSQHLCEAFFDSCCSHLPAFAFFTNNPPDFRGDPAHLTESAKVAIAVFCSIGARASPHSALLGIAPTDARSPSHLLNAGTRRESACSILRIAAHQSAFESSLNDTASILNLAAVLALMQMSIFHELVPKKSRSLLRVALGQFKDLQDSARGEDECIGLRRSFALSLYAGDAITSAYAQKQPLITESDLRKYFDLVGIVIPRYPGEDLISILDSLLGAHADLGKGRNSHSDSGNGRTSGEGRGNAGGNERDERGVEGVMRTATHLLSCHLYAAQRRWATISAPPQKSTVEILKEIPVLYSIIDLARSGITHVQSFLHSSSSSSHPHSHSHSHSDSYDPTSPHHGPTSATYDQSNQSTGGQNGHSHATDYSTMLIRADRDLLDLGSMIHVFLERAGFHQRSPGSPERVGTNHGGGRKGSGLGDEGRGDGGDGERGEEAEKERLWRVSCSRVRRGFRSLAFYAKVYLSGIDRHLIFHFAFQLELNPHWTNMVLQRFGEVGGPERREEEVSGVELGWLTEGLEAACYYMPSAERRLAELTSRFTVVPSPLPTPVSPVEPIPLTHSPAISTISLTHLSTMSTTTPLIPPYADSIEPRRTYGESDEMRRRTYDPIPTTYQYPPFPSHSSTTQEYQESLYSPYATTEFTPDGKYGVGGSERSGEKDGDFELEGYAPSETYYVASTSTQHPHSLPPSSYAHPSDAAQLAPPTSNYPDFSPTNDSVDYDATNDPIDYDATSGDERTHERTYDGGRGEMVDDWRGLY